LIGKDQATQKILYNKYQKIINDFILSKYPLNKFTDDDVSEILIKIFNKLNTYNPIKSKFKSWIFTITKNHMIDKWREESNMTTKMSSNSFNDTITISSPMIMTDSIFEYVDSTNYVLSLLTPKDYTFLRMKYLEGYDYNEIGIEFNLTSTTVSNRINYIKSKLKKNKSEILY